MIGKAKKLESRNEQKLIKCNSNINSLEHKYPTIRLYEHVFETKSHSFPTLVILKMKLYAV